MLLSLSLFLSLYLFLHSVSFDSSQVSTHHCNNLANSLSLPKVSPSISLFTFYCFALFALKSSLLHFLHQMQISKNKYISEKSTKKKRKERKKTNTQQINDYQNEKRKEKKRKERRTWLLYHVYREKIQNILTLMKCVCIICFTSKHILT